MNDPFEMPEELSGEGVVPIQVFYSPAVDPSTVEPRFPRGAPSADLDDQDGTYQAEEES